MSTIAIDCGASFLKGALFKNGVIVLRSTRKSPVMNTQEWNKPLQLDHLLKQIYSMIQELADGERNIALCISNEMHGFVLTDEDGIPYTDYISWQKEWGKLDLPGSDKTVMEMLQESVDKKDIQSTGMFLRAGLPSVNLCYLRYAKSWERQKGLLYFYTLGDYIIRKLSGMEPVCHITNAAATGLFDLSKKQWNPLLCNIAAGDKIIFPVIGAYPIEFDLFGIHITAFPAIGDQQAALYGSGLEQDDEISFNLGTGAQVSKILLEPEYPVQWQVRPYLDGKYIRTIPHLPSGRVLNVYYRLVYEIVQKFQHGVTEERIWKWITSQAEQAEDTDMQCDLSFFSNPLTVYDHGSLSNIGEYDMNVGQLFRVVFMQMANNFLKAADIITPDQNGISKVIFSGGVARKNNIIREKIRQHYPKEVEVSISKDETLYGLSNYAEIYKVL